VKISRELKVGFIFIASVAIFIWGMNFLKGTDVLSKKKFLYAVYDKVDGLDKANKVLVNGLIIGQVNNLNFYPGSSKIVAQLYIKNDIELPKNSIARIYSTSLLGGKAVEIILGDDTAIAQSGDTLVAEMESSLSDQVNEQVEPLKKKTVALIGSVDSVLNVIQALFNEKTRINLTNSIENIHLTLSNLASATSSVDAMLTEEKKRISSIITNLDSIAYNIEGNNRNINTILSNFANLSDSLVEADIPQTLRDASAAINNLEAISNKINRGEGTMGQLMTNDSLYIQLELATSNLSKLLEDVRQNPKKYVKLSLF
jgi:phospholipid/cholesterol/gamma-HCH transport system substrate-binding protein